MKYLRHLVLLFACIAAISLSWVIIEKNKQAYKLAVNSFEEFKSIQGAPLSDKFSSVLSVKVIYDTRVGILYFANSGAYRYHFDFCRLALDDNDPLEIFNELNYGNNVNRKYVLANLNFYEHSHIYALEFSSEDQVSAAAVVDLYKQVRAKTYIHDSLRLLIGSDNFVQLANAGKLDAPKIYPADIYKEQKFELLNTGVAYGILRKAEDTKTFTEKDIAIMKGTPVNVPVCAGIITNSFQTPLSHINILCHNRDIPSAVETDIMTYPGVKENLNKPVRLVVTKNGMTITAATMKDVDSFRKLHTNVTPVALKYDTSIKHLVAIKDFDLKQKNIIGNKAAGLGELNKIMHKTGSLFNVPESAFAIPFYFYVQHLSRPAIRWKINDLLKMQEANAPEAVIKEQLKLIRKAIKDEPIDAGLMAEIKQMIASNGSYRSFRFRSSANAEDVAGFSAAGLYDSKTGKVDDSDKPIDMAIKKVWASSYNDNAYLERAASHIDEHTMMMGILVHRNFPDEIANGVAVTRNLYRKNFPGYTINVQINEVLVVSPPDSVTCEQFICLASSDINPLSREIAADYITYSNINNNKPVLTHKQIKDLYLALDAVQQHYLNHVRRPYSGANNVALDMEFKFDKNGKLYIKQVRPYR